MQCVKTLVQSNRIEGSRSVGAPSGVGRKDKRARSAWDLCVRVVRGLAFSCLVLGGILVGAGVVTVASTARGRANRQIHRRAGQSPRRSRHGAFLFPCRPQRPSRTERSRCGLKALYGTGLFSDVQISQTRGRLVVTVVENPVINRVAFEGNKKAKDEQLKAEVQSKPRGTLSKPTVQADVQRIIEIYHRSGRFDVTVVPKIIELPNNRVDLVFEINEGEKTGVKEIRFIGNACVFGLAA